MRVFDLVLVVGYLALLLMAGPFLRRLVHTPEDFTVAGRRVGFWFGLSTLTVIFIGGGAVGLSGQGFDFGLSGVWYFWAYSIGFLVLGITFVGAIHSQKQTTLGDIVGRRFGSTARRVSSLVTLLAWLFFLASLFVAAGRVLETLLGIPLWSATVFVAVASATVASLGGWKGSTIVNGAQAMLLLLGIAVVFVAALVNLGGWNSLYTAVPGDSRSILPSFHAGYVFALLVVVVPTTVVAPDVYLNIWSARDKRTARRVVVAVGLLIAISGLMLVGVGAAARAIAPGLAPERALPAIAQHLLPPGISGLVLATFAGTAISAAVPEVLVCSSIFARDIYGGWIRPHANQPNLLRASRISSLVFGVIGCSLALLLPGVVALALDAYRIFVPATVPQIIAALCWRAAKPRAIVASILTGSATTLIQALLFPQTLLTFLDPVISSTAAAVAVLVLGSVLHRRRTDSNLEASRIASERTVIER